MKRYLVISITLLSFIAHSQESNPAADVNTLFELKLDSIELRITDSKWGIDTSRYFHYTVKNTSDDTLTFVTNSCFYYNHYQLKTENAVFDLNPTGGCSFNQQTPVVIPPGTSFSQTDAILSGLHDLPAGELNVSLFIPLVNDKKNTYRVDGRDFVENEQQLIFTGKTKVVKTVINKRKRKKSA